MAATPCPRPHQAVQNVTMSLARRLARPLLASTFVFGGIDAYRNPASKVAAAHKMVGSVPGKISFVKDTEQIVKYDGAVKVVAALLLSTGRMPRLMALALACTLVPTTFAGHRFWEETDPLKRKAQLLQFIKNSSILGGLILATVDTGGRPSVGWQTRRAAARLGSATSDQFSTASNKLSKITDRMPVG